MAGKPTGKAQAPWNTKRPASRAVKAAIASGNLEHLILALTPRQRAFCEEYIVDHNGKEAAIRAGYSPVDASRQAYNLLHNEGIIEYIRHLTASKEAKIVSVTPEYLIQELMQIIKKEGVKDADKIRTIELLMKHKGMFIERQEITGKDGGAIAIEQQKIEEDATDVVETLRRMNQKPDLRVVGNE